VFVRVKVAGVPPPARLAVTVKTPAVLLAVNTGAVATPLLFVIAVFTPPANVPLAPDPGAAKVTFTPLTGLSLAFFTVPCSWTAYAAPMTAFCGVPAVAVIVIPLPGEKVTSRK
jgi:hypothetical protein